MWKVYCFIAMLECVTAMPRQSTPKLTPQERVLAALRATHGIVTNACKRARVDRAQFFEWLKTDEGFAAAVADTGEIALDFAEASLFDQIRRKEAAATIFYLKTKGKKRGYVERQEVTGADGAPLIEAPYATLDDASLLRKARELVAGHPESGTSETA